MEKSVAIIGAGIGGLSTALALKQKGISASIYESADEIKPVGAGIIMANNAMQIFKKIGIQHKIEQAGHNVYNMTVTDAQLQSLSVINLGKYEQKYGVYNVAIHRADLQRILAEEIGFENIHLSKRLSHVEKANPFNLSFTDESTASVDILIGADGIKSIVRKQLFQKAQFRDAQQVCWRGVCEINLPEKHLHNAYEAWGKGKRFGFVKINANKTYWYAVANKNLVTDKVNLTELFKEFHVDLLDIISQTKPETIFQDDITDLKPIQKWHAENVCLIGDAAHATTPNLGQGACQAIEDAYAIAELFEKYKNWNKTFQAYNQLRIKKAHAIVNRSWQLGKISHWENTAAIWMRNILMKNIPSSANDKQFDYLFDVNYL